MGTGYYFPVAFVPVLLVRVQASIAWLLFANVVRLGVRDVGVGA